MRSRRKIGCIPTVACVFKPIYNWKPVWEDRYTCDLYRKGLLRGSKGVKAKAR